MIALLVILGWLLIGAIAAQVVTAIRYGRVQDHPSTTPEARAVRVRLYGEHDVYTAYYEDIWNGEW